MNDQKKIQPKNLKIERKTKMKKCRRLSIWFCSIVMWYFTTPYLYGWICLNCFLSFSEIFCTDSGLAMPNIVYTQFIKNNSILSYTYYSVVHHFVNIFIIFLLFVPMMGCILKHWTIEKSWRARAQAYFQSIISYANCQCNFCFLLWNLVHLGFSIGTAWK